jgi:hypothetical protein
MLISRPKSKGIVWKNEPTPYHEKRFTTAKARGDEAGFDASPTGCRAGRTEAMGRMSDSDSVKGNS